MADAQAVDLDRHLQRIARVALLVPVAGSPIVVLVLQLHPADPIHFLVDELLVARSAVLGFLIHALAQAIADMHVNRWVLMGLINVFLLVCGFFIPPAAILLMTAPILYPIIKAAGFDPVWFGVILTINMEIGLIHPPVGLNLFVLSSIAAALLAPQPGRPG